MFKRSIIVSASFVLISGLAGCSASASADANQGGSGGEAGGEAGDASTSDGGRASSSGGSASKGGSSAKASGSSVSCVKYGPITSNTTWEPLTDCPDGFDVPSAVVVKGADTTLTIKPGTVLKFAAGSGLEVWESAALVAAGTATSPITFTGWQKVPGSWGGIVFYSSVLKNEVSHAIVEYGGEPDGASAGIVVSHDTQYSIVKLSGNQIHDNAQYGVTVYRGSTLTAFNDNTITKNAAGAIKVEAPAVAQLTGTGNSLKDNGNGNIVKLETGTGDQILTADTTWPNLSPAVYRVTEFGRDRGAQIIVQKHLTIAPGAVFEFVGGSGIDVRDGSSGLSAIGTASAPIIFRGADGSGWTGIGFCESGWTGNALEEVHIENASGPPYSSTYCTAGSVSGVIVGQNFDSNAAKLRIKNLKISGPNNAPYDITVNTPSVLTQEGTNSGTGAAGALVVRSF